MRALSLWQPWASLWLSPRKVHETRSWKLQVPTGGFWLAVHAAKRFEREVGFELRDILDDEFGPHWQMELPRGAVVGCVRIVECQPTETIRARMIEASPHEVQDDFICGNFDDGRFGFRRAEYRVLREAVPFTGRQGFFDVPDDILKGPFLT